MADDKLAAELDAIGKRDKRVWEGRGNVGGLLAINDAKDDVPRLLAALDAALRHHHPRPREPRWCVLCAEPLPCNEVQDITRALLGESPCRTPAEASDDS